MFCDEGGEALEQLPREAADGPSPEVCKAGLEGALSSLVWGETSLPVAVGRTGWALRADSGGRQVGPPLSNQWVK